MTPEQRAQVDAEAKVEWQGMSDEAKQGFVGKHQLAVQRRRGEVDDRPPDRGDARYSPNFGIGTPSCERIGWSSSALLRSVRPA